MVLTIFVSLMAGAVVGFTLCAVVSMSRLGDLEAEILARRENVKYVARCLKYLHDSMPDDTDAEKFRRATVSSCWKNLLFSPRVINVTVKELEAQRRRRADKVNGGTASLQ